MKLKSLLLGSVAAAGLSTGAFAADVQQEILTSLDVCDALGLSGLTISSETNCLQISGGVDYRFRFGDYRGAIVTHRTYSGNGDVIGPDSFAGTDATVGYYVPAGGGDLVEYNVGDTVPDDATIVTEATAAVAADDELNLDWDSRSRAWVNLVASADSDFGPAKAHITLRQVDEWRVRNEGYDTMVNGVPGAFAGGDHTNGVRISEAYVSIGDQTVIMVGKKADKAAGSIANIGDDNPYSFLFISDQVDGGGVLIDADDYRLGGHSIQITSAVGDGITVSAGLENIDTNSGVPFLGERTSPATGFQVPNDSNLQTLRGGALAGANQSGTAIGVVSYSGETVSAHVTGLAFGVLDGTVEEWAVHAGATANLDIVKVTGALGYSNNYKLQDFAVLHGLLSAEASFDMFTVAVSGEFANIDNDDATIADSTDFSIGGKIGVNITDGVSINLDGAFFQDDSADLETTRIRLGAVADVTETLSVAAAVGTIFGDGVDADDENILFGEIGLNWKPGGNFTSGAKIEVNDEGGYRTEVTASKTFD
jgi:hypothetical protein